MEQKEGAGGGCNGATMLVQQGGVWLGAEKGLRERQRIRERAVACVVGCCRGKGRVSEGQQIADRGGGEREQLGRSRKVVAMAVRIRQLRWGTLVGSGGHGKWRKGEVG
ncbi:hypothetical protein AMTR_s00070p00099930 [Amborella trichopoda]|uniref:Uncharacterized protein n=1 Tax=Amborella trichopoda TaxID=13333 RepID=U5DJ36_AMBTC|nr:hypothetical protein AMTR_s00070p00099930 [Amborella trichopoda]